MRIWDLEGLKLEDLDIYIHTACSGLVLAGVAWCGLVWPGLGASSPAGTRLRSSLFLSHTPKESRWIYIYIYMYICIYIYIYKHMVVSTVYPFRPS